MKKNLILAVIIIAAFLIGGAVVYFLGLGSGRISGELSPQQAADKAIDYINQNKDTLTGGETVSLVSVSEENGLYKIKIKIGDSEFDSFVTKNGKTLLVGGFDLEPTPTATPETGDNTTGENSKRDTPDVKLFVMSYCPYGLQAEKMFLPVYNLLSGKAEMGVYFVSYAMHGKKEIDENLRQYCLQKEEKEKYYNYLSCFVEEDDFEKCLTTASIDQTKLDSCISETDEEYKITQNYNDESTWINGNYPKFDVQADLNTEYGVEGSPTIVINDKVVELNQRSPEKFKELICQAFNTPPSECSETLSDEVPTSGFGAGSGGSSGGSCE